ncbi:uncharacterized protein LOC124555752 [Schistocerca americana]|uniref:uncharacterized protein LOC124555752 n=1 Tax=Schistocerca americana TaxID=7009 RepID=UPI001F4F60BD|nr:uncharacterized protein LOC124555752 [Schistocerca americana]
MRRKHYLPTMVHAISVITVLKMMANAQTTCNQGIGRIVYERLPDQQLQGFDDDVVRDTLPPFKVLEKCQDLCLRDRTATNNLVRTCTSFDFQAGNRITSFSGSSEYEESTCYLTREQAHPEGIGNLVLVPNSVHFTEVCLMSSRIERDCPNRHYVFERHPRKKLKLPASDVKDVTASNRTDCEDRCLNEFAFVCRSATYDASARRCSLSKFTWRARPDLLEDDPNSDYLENTCLDAQRRCDGLTVFIKEENKRLGGPFEIDIFSNLTVEECQSQCVWSEKFFCRAIEYNEQTQLCILLEEDSMSQRDDLQTSNSPSHHLFDLVCLDTSRGSEFPDNSVTQHLFADGRRPDTAFQRYRNSRLGGDFQTEITGRTLSECLDDCLRQASFQCRSAVYSDRFRICRLSRYNQRDGLRIIYDADYDYYENLMNPYIGDAPGPSYRPDPLGQDSNHHGRPPYNAYPGGPGYSPPHGGYGGYGGYGGGGGGGSGGGGYPGPGGHYGASGGGGGGGYGSYPGPAGPPGPPLPPVPPVPPYATAGDAVYGGGPPPGRPPFTAPRCDEGDSFRQVGVRLRMRRQFIRRFVSAPSLPVCERECAEARDFICRAFNFRAYAAPYGAERENCELSDRDTKDFDINNPLYFETTGDYDFYERFGGRIAGDCLDVSQQCSEDGMEFTLRTPEGFFGRIYTYGFYDRCFFRGNGGTLNVLRISGAQGYPECGTQRYGDTMTNIVVVQFSDYVQTGRDKRYNLTCLFRGPGEAVVTSGYIGAGSGSPIPIEYLPAENSLSSRVRLLILYQGRPTTTIAVGDPLTFRLEAQDGYNYVTDIFATNVIARDPYSGRSVQLIDRYGCPVDNYVFPGLDRSRSGDGLEARFNAFKIPESNFLVFEATVRTCRDGCQPAYCTGHSGRSEPSFGRRKRDVTNETGEVEENDQYKNGTEEEEQVREMIEVFESRHDILQEETVEPLTANICLTNREYYGLMSAVIIFMLALIAVASFSAVCYRRYWSVHMKNVAADSTHPANIPTISNRPNFSFLVPNAKKAFGNGNTAKIMDPEMPNRCGRGFDDPSEPIYTDPSLFERSRSLRSITASQAGHKMQV